MNRTKNLNNNNTIRHRHSLIPHTVSNNQYHLKNRRLSAYQVSENYKQSLNHGPYPIAPMPSHSFHPPVPQPTSATTPYPSSTTTTFQPSSQYYHHNPSKPSAIDLLASAAEYVRTDRKEMSFSRT